MSARKDVVYLFLLLTIFPVNKNYLFNHFHILHPVIEIVNDLNKYKTYWSNPNINYTVVKLEITLQIEGFFSLETEAGRNCHNPSPSPKSKV